MQISKFRTLLLFGVVKDALNPKEAELYRAHRRAGKHNLSKMRRNYGAGLPLKTRKAIWNAHQNVFRKAAAVK